MEKDKIGEKPDEVCDTLLAHQLQVAAVDAGLVSLERLKPPALDWHDEKKKPPSSMHRTPISLCPRRIVSRHSIRYRSCDRKGFYYDVDFGSHTFPEKEFKN